MVASSITDADQFDQGERFFGELADNAPVLIWRSGPDKLCDWFNKPWLDFAGRSHRHTDLQSDPEGFRPATATISDKP